MSLKLIIVSALLVSISSVSIAQAQTAEIAISADEFSEGYSGKVNVSSPGALIGLRLGTEPGLNANSIDLIPQSADGSILCLRSSSLDGRFWSENPYKVSSGDVRTKVGPITKTFAKSLNDYPNNQITFRAAVTKNADCQNIDVQHYVPSLGAGSAELTVFLNSGGRRTFGRLSHDNNTKNIDVECSPIIGFSSVIADRVCKIDVPDVRGEAELKVAFINLTGQRDTVSYPIILPKFAFSDEIE